MDSATELSAQIITEQLNRILCSPLFAQSQRQCRFLRYIVNESLAGNANRLKGYTIGVEVFDRDVSFDPNIDSIVRVEAGRLRSKLREYYHTVGIHDAVYIELPKGVYTPVFNKNRHVNFDEPGNNTSGEDIGNSVAVLPLRLLSGEPGLEYFSEGMTDAIITALAKRKSLKVISLTSVLQFKQTQKPLKQIAKELKVTHVVEGSVLKDGNTVRITAQLIDSRTDFHMWCESFERKMNNVLLLQKEVADTISTCLTDEMITGQKESSLYNKINPKAYEALLLGQRTRAQFTRDAFYKATEYFRRAIELEPTYSAAYAGMASCYCGLGSHGFELECPDKIIPQGLEYAERAIELDNSLVDAHTYKGIMKLKYDWDWEGAEKCFKTALAISPSNSRAHLQFSMYYESLGQFDHALNEAQQALWLDPLSKEMGLNLAWQYYQADRFDEAKEQIDNLLKIEPGFWGAYWDLAHIYLVEKKYDMAIQAFEQSDTAGGGYFMPLQGVGYAYAVSGNKKKALQVIQKLDEIQKDNYVSPYYYATIYMGIGDMENTFAYLDQAFKFRSRSMVWLKVAKEYIPLRDDSRFKQIVKKIGIPG